MPVLLPEKSSLETEEVSIFTCCNSQTILPHEWVLFHDLLFQTFTWGERLWPVILIWFVTPAAVPTTVKSAEATPVIVPSSATLFISKHSTRIKPPFPGNRGYWHAESKQCMLCVLHTQLWNNSKSSGSLHLLLDLRTEISPGHQTRSHFSLSDRRVCHDFRAQFSLAQWTLYHQFYLITHRKCKQPSASGVAIQVAQSLPFLCRELYLNLKSSIILYSPHPFICLFLHRPPISKQNPPGTAICSFIPPPYTWPNTSIMSYNYIS